MSSPSANAKTMRQALPTALSSRIVSLYQMSENSEKCFKSHTGCRLQCLRSFYCAANRGLSGFQAWFWLKFGNLSIPGAQHIVIPWHTLPSRKVLMNHQLVQTKPACFRTMARCTTCTVAVQRHPQTKAFLCDNGARRLRYIYIARLSAYSLTIAIGDRPLVKERSVPTTNQTESKVPKWLR